MAGVCIECWLDLRCVAQQILLRVPESTTFRELFMKEVASKLASGDGLKESLTVSVSPTWKGDGKQFAVKTILVWACLSGAATSSFIYLRLLRSHRRSVFAQIVVAHWKLCFRTPRNVTAYRLHDPSLVVQMLNKLYSFCNYLSRTP